MTHYVFIMRILICLVQNACRKKCCLLIQHVTFISMFALIKYIFDCLCLLSFFFFLFFFFCSYLFLLVDKHTGNLPLSGSDQLVRIASPLLLSPPFSTSEVLVSLKREGEWRSKEANVLVTSWRSVEETASPRPASPAVQP